MPKATSILALSRRLRTYSKDATPRQRDDLKLASALLRNLAAIVEAALTRAACA
jgi:hypothetical protein